jgi:chemotaxis protein histidine kinase CheA
MSHATRTLPAVLIALLLAFGALFISAPAAHASETGTIHSLVNQNRAAAGLGALNRNSAMDQVAANWANQMAANGTLSHNPSYSDQIPGGWTRSAENVAQGHPTGAAMQAGWMNSSGHRANILGDYTDIGIAFINAGGTTWGVQVFGKYGASAAAPAPAPAPEAAQPAPQADAAADATADEAAKAAAEQAAAEAAAAEAAAAEQAAADAAAAEAAAAEEKSAAVAEAIANPHSTENGANNANNTAKSDAKQGADQRAERTDATLVSANQELNWLPTAFALVLAVIVLAAYAAFPTFRRYLGGRRQPKHL